MTSRMQLRERAVQESGPRDELPDAGPGAAAAPTAAPQRTRRWHRVCRLEDLEPLWGEAALVEGQQIALVRLPDDSVRAVSQWDPFARAHVMARGIVGSSGGRPTLASPIHKQSYDLTTGECLSQEGLRLKAYDVRIRGGAVEVGL